MKTEKKRVGTKAEIRATKNRERRIATAIFLAFILLIVILSSYFTYNFLNPTQNQTTNPTSSQLKAVIVDQLSLTLPNQTFIETATNTLKQAGYTVDYYPGENVTVEFYRDLLTDGYRVVILRVHSTTSGYPYVTLFTSEPYSRTKYVIEQLDDKVVPVAYSIEEANKGEGYFGINPSFVESNAIGTLSNAVVVAMGCESLSNTKMAEAFIQKGAKVYIGWSGSVSSSRTDQATIQLLQHLVSEGQTIRQAAENTIKEVEPDPEGKSTLCYYPVEARDGTIQNP